MLKKNKIKLMEKVYMVFIGRGDDCNFWEKLSYNRILTGRALCTVEESSKTRRRRSEYFHE